MTTPSNSETSINIAFVEAGWHAAIVARCREGFLAEIVAGSDGQASVKLFTAPGAYDIPLMAQKLAETGKFDAIVAAGFVVEGGIYRHDFVAGAVIDALMRVQLDTGVPVISSVLTPHQFQENSHHIEFFKDHFVLKGREAACAVLQIVDNCRSVRQEFSSDNQAADA